MGVNKYQPHVLVLLEDDANRQLVNGFLLEVDSISKIQILHEVGGWKKVLTSFRDDYINDMERFPQRFMVLLFDLDNQGENRLEFAKTYIPSHLTERVFILTTLDEPEDLKKAKLGHLETVGEALAKDCRDGTDMTWNHPLLKHNEDELNRLRKHVRPILFQS